MALAHNLGFPRIGRDRELKKAVEAYWKGELDEAGLRAVGRELRAAHWQVPTLLLWAGVDRLVNPAGSRAFAAAAPKERVQAHCFEPLYHELFNESPELAEPVFDLLRQRLVRRCAVPARP